MGYHYTTSTSSRPLQILAVSMSSIPQAPGMETWDCVVSVHASGSCITQKFRSVHCDENIPCQPPPSIGQARSLLMVQGYDACLCAHGSDNIFRLHRYTLSFQLIMLPGTPQNAMFHASLTARPHNQTRQSCHTSVLSSIAIFLP